MHGTCIASVSNLSMHISSPVLVILLEETQSDSGHFFRNKTKSKTFPHDMSFGKQTASPAQRKADLFSVYFKTVQLDTCVHDMPHIIQY